MGIIIVHLLHSEYCWRIRLVKVCKSIHNNDIDVCLLDLYLLGTCLMKVYMEETHPHYMASGC